MADPQSYRPSDIPKLPGVYRFYDATDTVIYVGKAINLKNRLSNYFQGNLAEKTYRMVHQAVRVDWTIVDTEVEALQLEFSWIKQYAPQYNVQFRDDKSYPYLAITNKEEFPRVFITRKSKRPGISYFGPFTHTWALRSTFDVVRLRPWFWPAPCNGRHTRCGCGKTQRFGWRQAAGCFSTY